MTYEKSHEGGEEVHDGQFWLNFFGKGHLADAEVKLDKPMLVGGVMTSTIRASQFLEVCGDHAIDMLEGLLASSASTDPADRALYEAGRPYAEAFLGRYLPQEAGE